jgi:AcrR family transcriptional regulator
MTRSLPAADRTETYHRYLDAAEQAFIRFGYEGASIRRISADAGAPLGTLHHYWGSKDVLFREVCARRFAPIQAEQLRRLRAIAAAVALSGHGRPRVEAVIRALVEPPMLATEGNAATHGALRLLYGRVLTEPSEVVKQAVRDMFRESTQLFRDLLRAACPQHDADVFYWRLTGALGAFIFSQSFGDRVGYALADASSGEDWRRATDEVVGFMVRGMG